MKRINRKIKKLLALGGSDNPFEAERAMVQAKALIKKYNVNEIDTQISMIYTNEIIDRPTLNQHEINLMSGICSAFKSRAFGITTQSGQRKPCFAGLTEDAQFSAFAFDCLYRQLKTQINKVGDDLNDDELSIYSSAWVSSVNYKLFEMFSINRMEKGVAQRIEQAYPKTAPGKVDQVKKETHTSKHSDIIWQGVKAGNKARLFVPVVGDREGFKIGV